MTETEPTLNPEINNFDSKSKLPIVLVSIIVGLLVILTAAYFGLKLSRDTEVEEKPELQPEIEIIEPAPCDSSSSCEVVFDLYPRPTPTPTITNTPTPTATPTSTPSPTVTLTPSPTVTLTPSPTPTPTTTNTPTPTATYTPTPTATYTPTPTITNTPSPTITPMPDEILCYDLNYSFPSESGNELPFYDQDIELTCITGGVEPIRMDFRYEFDDSGVWSNNISSATNIQPIDNNNDGIPDAWEGTTVYNFSSEVDPLVTTSVTIQCRGCAMDLDQGQEVCTAWPCP
jgi:hypothetical protein